MKCYINLFQTQTQSFWLPGVIFSEDMKYSIINSIKIVFFSLSIYYTSCAYAIFKGLHSECVQCNTNNPKCRFNQLSFPAPVCDMWALFDFHLHALETHKVYVICYKAFHDGRHHLLHQLHDFTKWFLGLWEPSAAIIRNLVVTLS